MGPATLLAAPPSAVHVPDRLRERFGSLLRHVVTDALQHPMRVGAGETLRVGSAVGGRAVEVGPDGDRGHADGRRFAQPALEIVIACLAGRQTHAPTVIMND